MIDKASIFYWMDRPLRFAKLLVNLFPIDLTNGFVKTTTMNYQSEIINNIRTAKLPFDKLLSVSLKCYEGHEGVKCIRGIKSLQCYVPKNLDLNGIENFRLSRRCKDIASHWITLLKTKMILPRWHGWSFEHGVA